MITNKDILFLCLLISILAAGYFVMTTLQSDDNRKDIKEADEQTKGGGAIIFLAVFAHDVRCLVEHEAA